MILCRARYSLTLSFSFSLWFANLSPSSSSLLDTNFCCLLFRIAWWCAHFTGSLFNRCTYAFCLLYLSSLPAILIMMQIPVLQSFTRISFCSNSHYHGDLTRSPWGVSDLQHHLAPALLYIIRALFIPPTLKQACKI